MSQYSSGEMLHAIQSAATDGSINAKQYIQFADNHTGVPSLDDIVEEYDTWVEARDDADVSADTSERTYSDRDIITSLRKADSTTSGTLTIDSYNTLPDAPASSVVIDRFGSWIAAKKAAGIGGDGRSTNSRPREYSTEQMLQMLRDCSERYGKVTQSRFDADDDFCASGTIVKRFGSWDEAKSTAGVE